MKQMVSHTLVRKYGIPAIAAVLGAVGGYCYYRFVGCAGGSCAITSNPYISTFYGGVIGFLSGSVFTPDKSMNKEEQDG